MFKDKTKKRNLKRGKKKKKKKKHQTCRMGTILVKGRLQKRKLSYNIIHVLKEINMAAIRVSEGENNLS